MMVIGANTPAMIKTMTREVESKNLIVASMHEAREAALSPQSADAGMCPRQQIRCICPELTH